MDLDDLFDQIAGELAATGVITGAMFGSRALKRAGKAFACLKNGQFAVRLGEGTPSHADALALPGAELFDPSGQQRPFKDWVALPAEHAEHWPGYAKAALGRH
jgi:hypothetical protein